MEEQKPFNYNQETFLNGKFVSKETFYEYQKEQDSRIDDLKVIAEKMLSSFTVLKWIVSAIAIPFMFLLLNMFLETWKSSY